MRNILLSDTKNVEKKSFPQARVKKKENKSEKGRDASHPAREKSKPSFPAARALRAVARRRELRSAVYRGEKKLRVKVGDRAAERTGNSVRTGDV